MPSSIVKVGDDVKAVSCKEQHLILHMLCAVPFTLSYLFCICCAASLVPQPPAGIVKVGDEVEIIGMKEGATKSTVTGVEMFKKLLNQGQAGDNVGLLLRGIKREDVQRGQVRAFVC
jgi:hypothetical protein